MSNVISFEKAKEKENGFTFAASNPIKPIIIIRPTETGFDIEIGEGISLTEAAKAFINECRRLLKDKSGFK